MRDRDTDNKKKLLQYSVSFNELCGLCMCYTTVIAAILCDYRKKILSD